jgi:hypothetical protein
VQLPRTREFDEERRRYGLVFTCEGCGHFDAARERCRHEYPIDEHRASFYEGEHGVLIFCKEFEIA